MFRPMAVTVVSSLAGSLFLALFIVPTLCSIALRHKAKQMEVGAPQNEGRQTQHKQNWFDKLRRYYERALEHSRRYSKWIFIVSGVLIVVALGSLKCIGTEFMPRLGEGSLVITSKRLPGISLTESIVIGEQIERTIKNFPEIQSVVTKLGRPDLATEAMGKYESDSYVSFTPEFQEASTSKHKELSDRIQEELEKTPGVNYEFTQPMQMRMDETITGTRGDVALKIFAPQNGGDLDTLERLGHQANRIVSGVAGASETQMELISGAEELQIRIDREEIARYGVSVANIREFIESLYGGKMVSEMLVDEQRFPIALRLPPDIRNNPSNSAPSR